MLLVFFRNRKGLRTNNGIFLTILKGLCRKLHSKVIDLKLNNHKDSQLILLGSSPEPRCGDAHTVTAKAP